MQSYAMADDVVLSPYIRTCLQPHATIQLMRLLNLISLAIQGQNTITADIQLCSLVIASSVPI